MKQHWKQLIGIFLAACSFRPVAGQLPDFHIIQTNEVDNKPIINIYSIVEDEEGFMWMGSRYGLFRYDGTSFTGYANDPADPASIPFGTIFTIVKSRRGGMWLGSQNGGLGYFDPLIEKAVRFEKDPQHPGSLAGESVQGLYEAPGGELWVGTDHFALHSLSPDGTTFEIYRPPLPDQQVGNYTQAGALGEIIPDRQNPDWLWIGSRFGIYRFDQKKEEFRLFPFSGPVQIWYQPLNVQLHMDAAGRIWAGSWQTGLLTLEPESGHWEIQKMPVDNELPQAGNHTIQDIFPYDEHLLLVMTLIDGLQWVDLRDGQLHPGPSPRIAGTPYPLNLLCAFRANNGDLWIGGNSAFLRLTTAGQPFPSQSFADINPAIQRNNWQRAYALSPMGNQLYIGTLRGDGLLIWDWNRRQLEAVSYRDLKLKDDTDVLYDDLCFDSRQRLWIGSDEGLLYLDPGRKKVQAFKDGLSPPARRHVAALCLDKDTLWAGTAGDGVFRINLRSGELLDHILQEGVRVTRILADPAGYIWIGGETGLWRYNSAGKQLGYFGRKSATTPGLSHSSVTDLELDQQGDLWISTRGGGLSRLKDADPEKDTFELFLNGAIPGGNIIYEIEIGKNSDIWLGTETGITLFEPGEKVFVNYDYRDGMFPKIGSMIQLPDGRIVSGDYKKFQLFDPEVLRSAAGPEAYLRDFRIFEHKIDLDRPVNRLSSISLSHGQNHFSLELGALNFTESARNIFAYQLEGYDQDWVYSGSRNYVSYTNLPTGDYLFKVKAANQHYRWSDKVKTLELIIRPPFWETWWFRSLVVLLLGGVAYRIIRFYQKRKQAKERQQAQEQQLMALDRDLSEAQLVALRAQMNPHFLFNCLNSINWYIIKNKPREASRYLTKFSRLIRMILDHSQSHKVPLEQELEALRLYVEMEAMRFDHTFKFLLEVDPALDLEEIEIAPLIFQPFVENAIWHGLMQNQKEENILRVCLYPETGALHCVIEDNGIGRAAAEKLRRSSLVVRESKGMRITADRITMLNHTQTLQDQVTILDLYDEIGRPAGTRVHIKLPLS